ncbi:MAG: hypothetical protein O7F73_01840 [Gammaproteobacteria bacterium]|nr:hypothetical protein [Gammaproteobacteria bacterium]
MNLLKPSLAGASEIHLWLTNPATITDEALLEVADHYFSASVVASLQVFSGVPLGETNELSLTTFGLVA